MPTPLRILVALPGLLFVGQSLGWLVSPASAAEGLGMPLLDGLARSTQVGDFAAFFLSLGIFILLGVARMQAHWLHAAALLLGAAAVGRTAAWAIHGADFAASFIAIEAAVAGLMVFGASRLSTESPN